MHELALLKMSLLFIVAAKEAEKKENQVWTVFWDTLYDFGKLRQWGNHVVDKRTFDVVIVQDQNKVNYG